MYKKFITPVYLLNIIFQSIFSLLTPAALMFLCAYLIDRNTEVGGWIYAVLIVLGIIIGLFSMISFILRAGAALEALEKQHAESEREKRLKERLRGDTTLKNEGQEGEQSDEKQLNSD